MRKISLLLLLGLIAAARWHYHVTEPVVKPDEYAYVKAIEALRAGASPYDEPSYFYTPFYAVSAATLVDQFGFLGFLRFQRAISLAGIILLVWLTLDLLGWPFGRAFVFGALWLSFAPVVSQPTILGNAAGVSAGLVLFALVGWRERPWLTGPALGVALAIKPLAPLAPLAFLGFQRGSDRKKSLLMGWLSTVTLAGLLLVGLRYFPGMVANAAGSTNPYNFSLQHILGLVGLRVRPIFLLLVVGGIGLSWIYSRSACRRDFLVAVVVLSLLAAPILWTHSLLILFPVQLMAAERIVRFVRARAGRDGDRTAFLWHSLAVLALVSTTMGTEGGVIAVPNLLRAIVLSIPLLSCLYLGWYVLAENDPASRPG